MIRKREAPVDPLNQQAYKANHCTLFYKPYSYWTANFDSPTAPLNNSNAVQPDQ